MEDEKNIGYVVREAQEEEWEDAMAVAWRTFMKFEAVEYPSEGVKNFYDFISDNTLFHMFQMKAYRLFVALDKDQIVGLISVRNQTHISLLFVEGKYHKQGIGSMLMEHLWEFLRTQGHQFCTVNAAPCAVGFYHKLGFEDTEQQQEKDGIIFTPMRKEL